MSADGSFVVNTPEGITMYRLLAMRGRLHLELKGLGFRQSTLAALQREGITSKRTKKGALADLNAHIESLGGPADRRSVS